MRKVEAKSIRFLCSLGALSLFPFAACTANSNLSSLSAPQRSALGGGAGQAPAAEPAPSMAGQAEAEDAPEGQPAGGGGGGADETAPADSPARPPAVLASVGSPVSGVEQAVALGAAGEAARPGSGEGGAEVRTPAPADPVAVERPAAAKPPVQLSAVPRTSVENRPTNQIMMVRTTAYSHLQADSLPYGNKSAAGTPLRYGPQVRSAAADWSKYPLGTRFMIEGLPYVYEVDDYGSALAGTETLDIYKPNLAGIRQWGARNVPVRVLEWGSFEESRRILESRKHVRHAHHVRQMLSEIERKARHGKLEERPAGLAPAPGGGA